MPPASRGRLTRAFLLALVALCFAISFYASYRPHASGGRRLSSVELAGAPWRVGSGPCDGLAGLLSKACRQSWSGGRDRPQGTPQAKGDLAQLPPSFDWEAYTLYNPQLGIQSEAEAQRHYLAEGRAQGRVYRKLRVLLRYTAGTGLINQHYSHIAAFALAAVLGAEVVLPPAMHRSSFQHIFSVRHDPLSPLSSHSRHEHTVPRLKGEALGLGVCC